MKWAARRLTATDVSREALAIAGGNAKRYGVDDRIDVRRRRPISTAIDDTFDLIAANPPYVKDGDKPGARRRRAPRAGRGALRRDRADCVTSRRCSIRRSTEAASGGWLVMEFGYGQEDDVRRLVSARPALRLERVRADLQGIPRTAIIRTH